MEINENNPFLDTSLLLLMENPNDPGFDPILQLRHGPLGFDPRKFRQHLTN